MNPSPRSQPPGNWPKNILLVATLAVVIGLLPAGSQAQPAGGLFTPHASFNLTNRLVSVSVFQWFSANGGQLTGPWRPVEGRSNWTGTTNFWRTQIKQIMAANFDMLYVHLIPSSEQERINLFQALNQLRREGWNVPKVAPFLDPMITWDQQPLVDVSTAAGKDTFVSQYIRWFNQYYSVNPDAFADDYLARINGRPILDTWHVKFNLANLASLSRADVETRMTNAFAAGHPIFTNGIYMVTTALNDPTFAWADEKVPQFEINEYSRTVLWRGVRAAQLKGGYWDQNIRNPGDFLPRAGGRPYSNAWSQVNRSLLSRVYVESWNEYDEGTGIYAANAGPPYVRSGSGNTNTDVWSSTNDPYEYIRTTARGAAAFNDAPQRDAKILWHNLPTRMRPGETRTATVIVRNQGDALWSEAAKYRFGQKEFLDPVLFGPGRYLLNDAQDDIPTYGGIFRGRPRTFTLSVQAPATPGLYTNHWSMLQELVTWFGEELAHTILVDSTPLYRGAPQSIDSTALLTNRINDYTEHTYVAEHIPVGGYAECRITRTFAAPVKSLKVSIVSGTTDDVGYVGNILVTPNSANVPCVLGQVMNEVDVTSAVSVSGNTASLTLRARESCCCTTGWGEDTESDRLNAKLRWEVELSPPVPFGQVFSNSANGRFYALLTPATWNWSERAAVALGGHLATVRNQAEQDWIFHTFGSYGGLNRLLWIGLNDVASEGHFVWSSGELVNFTRWAPGEPNNALTDEDFVTMYQPGHSQAGRWNDWGERVVDGSRPFNGVLELVAPMGPPRITSQPQGVKVNPGTSWRFQVRASGSPTLRYQWRFNGINTPGRTNNFYTLSDIQFTNAGSYSVVVTNALGAIESANAILIVNHAPVASPQIVSLDEDSSVLISLAGTDADGDALMHTLLTQPSHGQLSGVAPALTYAPNANYFGPDSFTFKVNDGLADSPVATIAINVRPVNDPPAAHSQSVSVNEDTLLPITLTASDVDGDALAYSIVSPPTHGSLSGTSSHRTYLAATNYFGPDSLTFKVNDGHVDSAVATVGITVLPVNDAPEPKIVVSPLTQLPGLSNLVVVAPVCSNAWVILDGSQSSDTENDPLEFTWTEGTNTLGTTATVTNRFAPGSHTITLLVSDGHDSAIATTTLQVLSPTEAVNSLAQVVERADLGGRNATPLLASLRAAAASFERCNLTAGLNQLEAFQHKVSAQIAPQNPILASLLIGTVQEIIDILTGTRPARYETTFSEVTRQGNGRLKLKFAGPKSRTCFVEASTNLIHWQKIGVAEALGDGTFRFDDPSVGVHPNRFYRIVSP